MPTAFGSGLLTVIYVIGFGVFYAGAGILFKYTSFATGSMNFWIFLVANTVGFLSSIFLTLALKNQNASITFAWCEGLGFFLLQVFCVYFFKNPLTIAQMIGIGLILAGMMLLAIERT